MRWAIAAALLAGQVLIGSSSVSAQEQFRPLTPAEQRAFEACMFAAWVEDYCESTYWGFSPISGRVRACVRANGGGRFPLEPHHLYTDEDYCRGTVQRPYR
jgi:hypothetical protein